MQSITVLPDMVVEKESDIRLEVYNGRARIYVYDDLDEVWFDTYELDGMCDSFTEFFLKTAGENPQRMQLFVEKLELQTSYDAVVEYWATELEDAILFENILKEIMGDFEFLSRIKQSKKTDLCFAGLTRYIVRKADDMIKAYPELKGHISLLKGNDTLKKECAEKIINNYNGILKELNIQEYLIDLFRKSASFEELIQRVSGNSDNHIGWYELVNKTRKKCDDMIKAELIQYIKKGAYNTCKV